MKHQVSITWGSGTDVVHRNFEVECGFLVPVTTLVEGDTVIPFKCALEKLASLCIAVDGSCELAFAGREYRLSAERPLFYIRGGLIDFDASVDGAIDGIGVKAEKPCTLQMRAAVDL